MKLLRPCLLLALGLLAGCTAAPGAPGAPLTPTQQFAPQIRPGADEIQLAPHGWLSANQADALGALVLRWREAGEGPIIVQAPAAGPGAATGAAAAAALRSHGVPEAAIRAVAYESAEPAPVRVGYSRYEAVIGNCAHLWGDVVRTAENRPMPSFGCSVSNNMAAQVANARDLAGAQPVDAGDSRRRVMQLNSYREGKQPEADSQGGNP